MKTLLVMLLLSVGTALANTKTEQIKIVVPFATGGPTSNLAFQLQKSLTNELKIPVIVDHRPGDGGSIGTSFAIQSHEPSLILNTSSIVLNTFRNPQPYHDNQLRPTLYLGNIPLILVASKKSNIVNWRGLKNSNRILNYGSAGTGSTLHLSMETLNQTLKLNLTHVGYKGTSLLQTDLIAGHLDMAFMFASRPTIELIKKGDLVALAVDNSQRLHELESVPTFKELGVTHMGNISWYVLFAAGQWNPNTLASVQKSLQKTLTDSELSLPYKNFGLIWEKQRLIPAPDFVAQQRKFMVGLVKYLTFE